MLKGTTSNLGIAVDLDRTLVKQSNDDRIKNLSEPYHSDVGIMERVSSDPEEEENNLVLTISPLPYSKERTKELTCVMAHLQAKLHDLDWPGFDKYASELLRRHPDNIDYKASVLVHRPYALRVKHGAHFALKYLLTAEQVVLDAPSSDFIRIKFLTMKAFLLYFLGDRQKARDTHELAIQESTMLEANSSSAHNLYYYSLNVILHNSDLWNSCGVPLESAWSIAENSYRKSCELHKRWVEDLDDDKHLAGENSSFFFLITMSKYIMCLLRSCAAPEGFYRLMTSESITRDKLSTAGKYLDEVQRDSADLSPRGWLYYCLAQSDYFIRKTQLYGDGNKYLSEAKSWAEKASIYPAKYKDRKISKFTMEFSKCRIEYIDDKLANKCVGTLEDAPGPSKPGSHLVPLKTSNFMSHRDIEKISDPMESTCINNTTSNGSEQSDNINPGQLASTDANNSSINIKLCLDTDSDMVPKEMNTSMRSDQCVADDSDTRQSTTENTSVILGSDIDVVVKNLVVTTEGDPDDRPLSNKDHSVLVTRIHRQSELEAETEVKDISRKCPFQ